MHSRGCVGARRAGRDGLGIITRIYTNGKGTTDDTDRHGFRGKAESLSRTCGLAVSAKRPAQASGAELRPEMRTRAKHAIILLDGLDGLDGSDASGSADCGLEDRGEFTIYDLGGDLRARAKGGGDGWRGVRPGGFGETAQELIADS